MTVQTEPLNPRAVPGSNEAPDYAQQVTDRMASEYAEVTRTLDSLLTEALAMPKEVTSDNDALMIGALIKRLRDVDARCESIRSLEKEPYLRGGNAIDSFFNALRDKIGRRNKNDRKSAAGATDVLQARINEYQERKIAEETARREAEHREAARKAREVQEKAAREAMAAEEARLAAERARKADAIVAKTAVADARADQAAQSRVAAETAANVAEDARLATFASGADMARVRGNDQSGAGVVLTVAKEPYAIMTDRALLDLNALRPFFTDAELEKALRAWARALGHRVTMPGAEIGFRNKGVTR